MVSIDFGPIGIYLFVVLTVIVFLWGLLKSVEIILNIKYYLEQSKTSNANTDAMAPELYDLKVTQVSPGIFLDTKGAYYFEDPEGQLIGPYSSEDIANIARDGFLDE